MKKFKNAIKTFPSLRRDFGGIFSLCIFMSLTYSSLLSYDERIYSGPIDVPGIESVTVTSFHYPSLNLTYQIPYSNTISIEFEDGSKAKIRDANRNFHFDEGDEDNEEWTCEHCGETFELDEEEEERIEEEGFIKVKCPHCHKTTTCEYEDE